MEDALKQFNNSGELDCVLETIKNSTDANTTSQLGEFFLHLFPSHTDLIVCMANFYYKNGSLARAFELCEKVPALKDLQTKCVSPEFESYPSDIVKEIKPEEYPLITFTITTCKRLELFKKTMNSFLHCCLDRDLIGRWICVDDNSSEQDRNEMKELYPFFEFIFKKEEDRGHARSMNIIAKTVSSPFVFHMEDDWYFFHKTNYLGKCLDVLSENKKYGQCLINLNYGELPTIKIIGGEPKSTLNHTDYVIHEYCKNDEEVHRFVQKHGNNMNCSYWPHYSLRPSLLRRQVFNLSAFNESKSVHFEMEYAYKYIQAGFMSVFLNGNYCKHTGRLTSERHDETKLNAYTLNETSQFGEQPKPKAKTEPLKYMIINLNRRLDRLQKLQKNKDITDLNCGRFAAIDGKLLVNSERLQRIFDNNDYNMKAGMVGCALSHISLWIQLVNSNLNYLCILEDDIETVPDFKEKLKTVATQLTALPEWGICFLGYHVWPMFRNDEFLGSAYPSIIKMNTLNSFKYSMGGTTAYIISKYGAQKMLEYIDEIGMPNCIDTMQQRACDIMPVYYCKPMIIHSECADSNQVDTDIQREPKSFTIPSETRLEKYIVNHKLPSNILQTEDYNQAKIHIETKQNSYLIYRGRNIEELWKNNRNNTYHFAFEILLYSPSIIEYTRLKQNNKFDISNVLIYSIQKIPLLLADDFNLQTFLKSRGYDSSPFGNMYGITFETVLNITEKILTSSPEEFTKDYFNPDDITSYVQPWNGKHVMKNTKYNISHPHDDNNSIYQTYTAWFKKFKDSIVSNDSEILFILNYTWKSVDIDALVKFITFMRSYTRQFRVLLINGIETLPDSLKNIVFHEKIPYDDAFKNDEWPNEKIRYENEVFLARLTETVSKYID